MPVGVPLRYHRLIRSIWKGTDGAFAHCRRRCLAAGESCAHAASSRGTSAFAASRLRTLQPRLCLHAPIASCLILSLPGAYGHEICRAIRQESNVPIIVLTSSDSEFDEVMSMSVGADDYVVKPYRPAALLARIDRAACPQRLCRFGAQAAGTRRRFARPRASRGVVSRQKRRAVAQRAADLARPHGERGLHHLAQRADGRAVANRRVRRRQHAHGEREPPAPQPCSP